LYPSFRVFEANSQSFELNDYLQYRFNVTKANIDNVEKPKWDLSYRATEVNNIE